MHPSPIADNCILGVSEIPVFHVFNVQLLLSILFEALSPSVPDMIFSIIPVPILK